MSKLLFFNENKILKFLLSNLIININKMFIITITKEINKNSVSKKYSLNQGKNQSFE